MKTTEEIIKEAIDTFKPIKILLLFSGGHDSLVSTHKCATVLNNMGLNFEVYHGDTTIGIPETQQFVIDTCKEYKWKLNIRKPPNKKDHYESIVAAHGFPGSTKTAHRLMFRRLKERALRHFVTHECKSKPHARENVLLLTGVRKNESKVRMGYVETTTKDNSRIWCNAIFYWTKEDCEQYIADNLISRNPVKDAICISGECLCGCYGSREEFAEIQAVYPHTAARIKELHEIAKKNGKPWFWGSGGPPKKRKEKPKNENIKSQKMFMCVGCEDKRQANENRIKDEF